MQSELAVYAVHPSASKGRIYPELPASGRTEFQRDRDRIIHCSAFRRLEYKTQVFVNHEGDLFRTRLTHSIEVAQIARSIARSLRLNEDLVEAISLAHDLGHTPFGHAGQDALHECMQAYGGFEHNLQSLRIVDLLEERYAGFNGLNLCFETREGILKHCSVENARMQGEIGQRFLQKKRPSLEAQLCNLADEIAYNNHDIDDGIRSGLLTEAQLCSVSLYERHRKVVSETYPEIQGKRAVSETIRRIIHTLITDLVTTSSSKISECRLQDVDDVRNAPLLIAFSSEIAAEAAELKQFLFKNLYRHFQVSRMMRKSRIIIEQLFQVFMQDNRLLPPAYHVKAEYSEVEQARRIADYIAGMTDRYAMREYKRLFSINENIY